LDDALLKGVSEKGKKISKICKNAKKTPKKGNKPTVKRATKDEKMDLQDKHKLHLLTMIAHGMMLSSVCDKLFCQSILLSILPKNILRDDETEDFDSKAWIKNLVAWWKSFF